MQDSNPEELAMPHLLIQWMHSLTGKSRFATQQLAPSTVAFAGVGFDLSDPAAPSVTGAVLLASRYPW